MLTFIFEYSSLLKQWKKQRILSIFNSREKQHRIYSILSIMVSYLFPSLGSEYIFIQMNPFWKFPEKLPRNFLGNKKNEKIKILFLKTFFFLFANEICKKNWKSISFVSHYHHCLLIMFMNQIKSRIENDFFLSQKIPTRKK